MLTDTSIELRSPRPSLMMRAVSWLMSKRTPPFPPEPEGVRATFANRKPPLDAPMPQGFEKKYKVERWEAAGEPVVTLHPKAGAGEWHMLYFHGGGFVLPMFKVHWPLVAAMVEALGCSISVPLYPVVPEHSHAAADAQADAAFAALAERHDPSRIILNGDSAGGHMALSLALRLARAGGPQPGKLALFAPWLDVTGSDEAMRAVEPHDVMLRVDSLRVCGEMWAGDRDPSLPECSPLFTPAADLAQLPPTRIWTGRHDLFIIDSRTFVARLREAGVDAKLYEYEAAPHVFMAITATREAKDVFGLLETFLAQP
jgi:acetyl esterase/lipase